MGQFAPNATSTSPRTSRCNCSICTKGRFQRRSFRLAKKYSDSLILVFGSPRAAESSTVTLR